MNKTILNYQILFSQLSLYFYYHLLKNKIYDFKFKLLKKFK